jgi:hypothetical protein
MATTPLSPRQATLMGRLLNVPRDPTSIRHDRVDATRVLDVAQRVSVEEDQVGRLSGREGADGFSEAERAGGLAGRALERGERCHAGGHHERELVVQREAGNHVRVAQVCAGKQRNPGA